MTDEERKEKQRKYNKKWLDAHPNYHKAYYEEHKEKAKETAKKWNKKHPEKLKEYYKTDPADTFNHRAYWPIEHIELVLKHEMTDKKLSKLIGRTIGAIHAMRNKMRKREGEGVILMEEKENGRCTN